ncbi:glucosamine--fructose-6-phosphate aminotransferase [Nonomuraea coxensis DSM 45129]|uniref:Glutamine--fructose-6-phosphate aminotransferase [isomerizing] n=1 Tax=Nonomuraea coxensis DSM 45129 TaxID=1122611 RepID=A0ABX8TVT1_9ACTN|nr:glucosamine--fructose-6-phosphate aminotransferase [Nonomuraea coxensis DSM 45129]
MFGAGSGFYLAQIGQFLLANLAEVAANALFSGEAEHFTRLGPGDSAVAISQSGETFDTLEMCRVAQRCGAALTSISNVPNSSQERMAVHRLRQECGPEISEPLSVTNSCCA